MALNFGKLNFSTSFNPTSAFPIDARTYFESLASAQEAAATAEEAGSANTTYYYGQILVVNEGGTVAAYQITTEKSLQKLAATTSSGDLASDVAKLQGQVGQIESTLSTISGTLSTIEGTVSTHTENIATLSSGLEGVKGTVSTLSTNLTALTGRVTTAEGTLGTLSTQVATNTGDIATLSSKLADLGNALHFVGAGAIDARPEEAEAGDVYIDTEEGVEYIYSGTAWEEFGNQGDHLTKAVADGYYVPLSRTINGKTLSANVTLSAADIADLNTTITGAIGALDVASVSVGAGETISAISQTDGVISVTKQTISITQAQVDGLTTALAGKQDTITVSGNGILTISEGVFGVDTNTYATTSSVESSISTAIDDLDLANTYLGLHAKADSAANADKVANKLTIGSKEFDGSAEVTVTATDLGALTAVPQATTDALGGIKLGHTEGANEHAVVLDDDGKAYVTVSIPAAVTYSAGAGLTLSENTFAIANGGVTVSMLAGNITDDKITSLDVQKLTQKEEDTLIIDGGTAN